MTWPIAVHPLAEEELNEAAAYYEARSRGLGVTFLSAVETTLDRIATHPEAGIPVTKAIRRKIVSQFPYSLLYAVAGEDLRVLAVMHHKRRPFYWRRRG